MPICDCAFSFVRACASVTCPTSRVPFFTTTCPSCFTSCVATASTRSPALFFFASSEFFSVASILVPSEMSVEPLAAPAVADEADDVVDLETSVEFLPALAEADEEVDFEMSAEFWPVFVEAAVDVDADPLLEA